MVEGLSVERTLGMSAPGAGFCSLHCCRWIRGEGELSSFFAYDSRYLYRHVVVIIVFVNVTTNRLPNIIIIIITIIRLLSPSPFSSLLTPTILPLSPLLLPLLPPLSPSSPSFPWSCNPHLHHNNQRRFIFFIVPRVSTKHQSSLAS